MGFHPVSHLFHVIHPVSHAVFFADEHHYLQLLAVTITSLLTSLLTVGPVCGMLVYCWFRYWRPMLLRRFWRKGRGEEGSALRSAGLNRYDVASWTPESVAEWVSHDCGLPQYSIAFTRNAIDGVALLAIQSDELKEVGISAVGHRKKIESALAELRASKEAARRGITGGLLTTIQKWFRSAPADHPHS